jgi:hypothetical protein
MFYLLIFVILKMSTTRKSMFPLRNIVQWGSFGHMFAGTTTSGIAVLDFESVHAIEDTDM